MKPDEYICPHCETPGDDLGNPCTKSVCLKREYYYIPLESYKRYKRWIAEQEMPEDPEIGHVVDRYLVIEKLGQGGMGAVYLALQMPLQREVALKMVSGMVLDDVARQRFEREAKAISIIYHPNIVGLIDYGFNPSSGAPFMSLEFVKGGRELGDEIEARLSRGEAWSNDDLKNIFTQILNGLGVAHKNGLIHRDIKPQNIMLVSIEGNSNFVKILDFGLARALVEPPGQSKLTVQGTIMGTPQYMAPEQVMGSKDIDHRCDLYAVGVILFEMVTQQEVFAGDNMRAILTNKINPDYDPFQEISGPPMHPAIEAFLRKVLSIQPDDRYFKASDMKDALQMALDRAKGETPPTKEEVGFAATMEMPVHSIPPGPMLSGQSPGAQQVDVVTLGKSKVVTTPSSGTIESRPSQVYGKKKSRAVPIILVMLLLLAGAAVAGYFFVLPHLGKTTHMAQGAPGTEIEKAGTLTTGTDEEKEEPVEETGAETAGETGGETAEKEGEEIIDMVALPPGLEGESKKKGKKKGKKDNETGTAAEEVKEPPPLVPPKIEIVEPPPDLPKKPSKSDIKKARKVLKSGIDTCTQKLFGIFTADIVFQGKTGSVMDVANQFWDGSMSKGKGCIQSQIFQVTVPPFSEDKFVVPFKYKAKAKLIPDDEEETPAKEESGTGLKMLLPGLTKQDINNVFQKQKLKKKLEACAAGKTGTVVIQAVVNGSGKVTSAEIVGDFAGTNAEGCMLKAVKGLKFPESMKLETQINKTIQIL